MQSAEEFEKRHQKRKSSHEIGKERMYKGFARCDALRPDRMIYATRFIEEKLGKRVCVQNSSSIRGIIKNPGQQHRVYLLYQVDP